MSSNELLSSAHGRVGWSAVPGDNDREFKSHGGCIVEKGANCLFPSWVCGRKTVPAVLTTPKQV